MDGWLQELGQDLADLEAVGLRRHLVPTDGCGRLVRRGGRALVNLCGNDYLALAGHPQLRRAAIDAIAAEGTGAGASRLIGGHTSRHGAVESRFARLKHAEAALLCPTGYMANLAALGALAGRDDAIFLDHLNHASLIDAARATRATVRTYRHRDLLRLRSLLAGARSAPGRRPTHRARGRRCFIVTDSVFSMDGDCADLPALCDLADAFDAILIVDEAHATGVLGPTGAGLAELQQVAERVDVVVSTASKALGGLGGVVTARRCVIDTIVNRARSFIYTTGVPPGQAAVLDAAMDVLASEPGRRRRLAELAVALRSRLADIGMAAPSTGVPEVPIIPVVVGTTASALQLAAHLERAGLFVAAIRPPTVARGTARLRISLRADLLDADLDRLVLALRSR